MMCHAYFNGAVAEDDLRQILKLQSAVRIHQTWARQNRTEANVRDWTQVEWRSTLAIIHDHNTPKGLHTSPADCSKRAHRVKKLHGMLPTLSYMKHWRPDLYHTDICRRCELEKEDTCHLWHCPETMDEQKRKWQETIEGMNTIGNRVWRAAKKEWEEEKKKWEEKQGKRPPAERGKAFSRRPPTFKDAQPDQIWETLEVLASGASAIRNGNMDLDLDSGMEIDVMADWKVQDLYHGLTPKALASNWKRLHATSSKIAAYMAGRFVEMIEGIGKTEIWNKRCEVTIEWERGQGITTKKKRDRTRQEDAQRQNG
ncbi:hypothetical protein BGX20_009937, partial [Mortierella sp. AD010]